MPGHLNQWILRGYRHEAMTEHLKQVCAWGAGGDRTLER